MSLPVRCSAWLARQTPWFISGVAIITFFCPQTFAWVRGDMQTIILGIIMLAMGMTLTTDDFRILASRPLDIAIGAIAQYVLMPTIAFTLARLLGLPRGVAVGLMLVGVCPGGVSSNVMSFLCRGDVAFSVGMTTITTLLAPVFTPFLMKTLAGELVAVDALGMFQSVLLVTLLPVILGFTLNSALGKRPYFVELRGIMPGIAVLGLACVVGGVISAQGTHFIHSGLLVFVAVFCHNALGYVTGYCVGIFSRFSSAKRRTIAIEVGMQNAGLATVLATRHFANSPEAAVVSAVSCVWHSISGAFLAGIFNTLDCWLKETPHATTEKA